MLLHDTAILKWTEKKDQLDSGTVRTVTVGEIPCEVTPIDSEPASDSGTIKIRYRFFTTVDLVALADAQLAYWKANPGTFTPKGITMTLTYDGKTISPEASFERHKVLGRFHHIEAIMKDFGFTGA